MRMSEAQVPLTVPRHLLKAPGGISLAVVMLVTSITLLIVSTYGYTQWGWYGFVTFIFNVMALHLAGTVIHDACHNAAHSNRIVNGILGHGSALVLGFTFPVFTRVHLQHHAHVNDPDNDPDHVVSTGGPLWLIAPRFFYHEIYFFQRRLWRKYELLEWFISRLIVITFILSSVKYGFLSYVLNFWFCPALFVGLALGLFFDYFPHRPFAERNRWKNARVYPSPLVNLLILGQNYHLVHHLWPSAPWYHYQTVYREMKPLLDAKGCPQCMGILESEKDFWNFVYDIFLGVRPHQESLKPKVISQPGENPENKEKNIDLPLSA